MRVQCGGSVLMAVIWGFSQSFGSVADSLTFDETRKRTMIEKSILRKK
jgi:hypothetical protein